MLAIAVSFLVIIESLLMIAQNEEINGLKEENQYLRGALREYEKKEADSGQQVEYIIMPEAHEEVIPLDHD